MLCALNAHKLIKTTKECLNYLQFTKIQYFNNYHPEQITLFSKYLHYTQGIIKMIDLLTLRILHKCMGIYIPIVKCIIMSFIMKI